MRAGPIPCATDINHFRQARVEKGLPAEETDVADTATAQNFQGTLELVGIDPSQIRSSYLPVCKVAEVARGIARVSDGNIA
jgi:hypothetical protein